MDSAGRLQVPKEYLEQFDIKGRARLELAEEGILIRPAPQAANAQTVGTSVTDLVPMPEARGWPGIKALPPALQATLDRAAGLTGNLRGRISQAATRLPFARRSRTATTKGAEPGFLNDRRRDDGDGRDV